MKIFKWLVALWVALALVACGGGGGSAGVVAVGTSTETGSGTGGGTTAAATITLQLVDATGKELSPPSLSQTETRNLKVTLTNAKKEPQSFKRVTVTLDSQLAVLTPQSGAQLTDASGVALFAIAPASVASSGAVSATAKASVDGADVSQMLDLQITAGNVTLSGLTVTPASAQLGQSVNVSVNASVNGQPAASNSVTVAFSSACGTVSPASAAVDASGKASAVIQTMGAGSCSVSALAVGVAQSVAASFTVATAPVTGIQFVQASPAVIYQSDSVGANSSLVKFKVIDSNGNPVGGQTVNAALVNGTGGLHFCDSSASGNMAVSAATTGEVSFSVCAGTQPETAQVRATLAASAGIYTDSNLLTVQTGLPTQRFFDMGASRLNFYAGGRFTSQYTNDSVDITVNLADRQGNPVPNGTPVVFVTEGGQINSSNVSSCIVSNGGCTVKLLGQEYRPLGASVGDPRPGRVTVLAMADGEESFIDANNNNRYDPGELFEDLGVPFMDKNEDGTFTAAYKNLGPNTDEGEVSYPIAAAAVGTSTCPGNSNVGLSQTGTCNGVWNGSGTKPDGSRYVPNKVRRAIVIVFSGGEIGLPNASKVVGLCGGHSFNPNSYHSSILSRYQTDLLSCDANQIKVRLADLNGNPLPADATVKVNVRPSSSKCVATLVGSTIGNQIEPSVHMVNLNSCRSGESLDFQVDVASGSVKKQSVFTVTAPVAPSSPNVKYEVTGSGTADVTYATPSGTAQDNGVVLPFEKSYSFLDGEFLYMSASNITGETAVKIYVNNNVVAETRGTASAQARHTCCNP